MGQGRPWVMSTKEALISIPVLKYFDPDKNTVVQCNASERGLGSCIMQDGHPIAQGSTVQKLIFFHQSFFNKFLSYYNVLDTQMKK